MTEAGIPILTELQKQITDLEGKAISVGDVFDRISKRQVSFEMVEKVFKDMTSEGGKFYQMQEVLADTLSGKLSNLSDAYQIMFSEIGERSSGILNGAVDALRGLADNYEKVGKVLITTAAAYGTARTAMLAYQLVVKELAVSDLTLVKSFKNIAALAAKNPYVAIAAGVAALAGTVATFIVKAENAEKMTRNLQKAEKDASEAAAVESRKLEELKAKLDLATEGTEEYDRVKNIIYSKYASYIKALEDEGIAVDNLANIYDRLKQSVEAAARDSFMNNALQDVEEQFSAVLKRVQKQFNNMIDSGWLKRNGISAKDKEALWQYVIGDIDKNQLRTKMDNSGLIDGIRSTIERLRATYTDASKVYTDAVSKVTDAHESLKKSVSDDTFPLNEFAKRVRKALEENKIMSKEDDKMNLWITAYDDQQAYLEKIRKRYAEINEQLSDTASYEVDTIDKLKREKDILEDIFRLTQKSPLAPGSVSWQEGDSETKIKAYYDKQVSLIKDLMKNYQQLLDFGMEESEAKEFLIKFFPEQSELINMANYRDRLLEIADAYDKLEDGSAKAKSIRDEYNDTSFDAAFRKLKDLKGAEEKFQEIMQSWFESSELTGTGAVFDISRIIAEYKKGLAKLENQRDKANKALLERAKAKLATGVADDNYFADQNAINAKHAADASALLAKSREEAIDKIKSLYKEWRDETIDFNNLSDKSLTQLREMANQINNYALSIDGDSELLAYLKELGIGIEEVSKIIEETKRLDLNKLVGGNGNTGEVWKKQVDGWLRTINTVMKVSEKIRDIGEASGNKNLVSLYEGISFAGQTATAVLSALKEGVDRTTTINSVIGFATALASKFLESIEAAQRLKREIEEMTRKHYFEALSKSIEDSSTIFGESWMGQIRAIVSGIKSLKSNIDGISSTVSKSGIFSNRNGNLESYLKNYADKLGLQLKNEKGLFIQETLERIQLEYAKSISNAGLTDELQSLMDYNAELIKMFGQLDDAMSSMFNSLGESITDKIIENLWAVGDAVVDLESVFGDLGNTIFKSLVQSIVVDDVLSKFKGELEKIWTDDTLTEDDIAQRLSDFADNVASSLEDSNEKIMALFDAFNQRELITNEAVDSETTLGNGIKSITEDTANLLASYVNAIRADVSMTREMISQFLGLMPQSPTLADYLTQIQANTYNTAENTAGLLSELRSMMTTSDGPALRVFM